MTRATGPRPVASSAPAGVFYDACRLCTAKGRPCTYHRASGMPALMEAVARGLKTGALQGLAGYFEAAFAAATATLPDTVLDAVASCDTQAANAELGMIMDRETLDAPALRRLGALALALALACELGEDDGEPDAGEGEGDGDG